MLILKMPIKKKKKKQLPLMMLHYNINTNPHIKNNLWDKICIIYYILYYILYYIIHTFAVTLICIIEPTIGEKFILG